MDAAKGAIEASPRILRRDAEINRISDLTLAIAYQRLLDRPADLLEGRSSVQPQLAYAQQSAGGKESGNE